MGKEQSELARRCTYPLFAVIDGKHGIDGSSVLLASAKKHYLITARHVGIESGRTKLFGDSAGNPFGEFFILPEEIDVTIVEVVIPTFFENLGYDFLPIELWGINHVLRHREAEAHYLVAGYPYTKTPREVIGRKASPVPFGFWTRSYGEEEMHILGCNALTHLALRYIPGRLFDERNQVHRQAPQLEGMSGCGIWDTSGQNPVLMGILTRKEPPEKPISLIGTRIDAVSEVIRETLDDSMPMSSRLGVSVKVAPRL